jgi:hypothetical protein
VPATKTPTCTSLSSTGPLTRNLSTYNFKGPLRWDENILFTDHGYHIGVVLDLLISGVSLRALIPHVSRTKKEKKKKTNLVEITLL